jgi:hypothetical protein
MPAPAPSPPLLSTLPADVQGRMPALLDDAARRSGVPVAQLQVRAMQAVTWSDGSMGCPIPGRMYTQALVPGWRVEIATAAPGAGAVLHYHASRRGAWLWCPAERAQAPIAEDPAPKTR